MVSIKSINVRTCYKLIGSDFSQQEVRVLAELSKDPNLLDAYKQNKDIYATVASGVYKMDYWDCMEHHQDGSANPEGKKRRASCKSIVLGIMYSRGAAAIAEQIHSTKEEAQKIVDDFYIAFPTVKSWMDESLKSLKKNKYVEDFYGRRRRLVDIDLVPYKVSTAEKNNEILYNPFIDCPDKIIEDPAIPIWVSIIGTSIILANATKLIKNTGIFTEEISNKKYEALAKLAISAKRNKEEIAKLIKDNNTIVTGLKNNYIQVYNFDTKKLETVKITTEFKLFCTKVIHDFPIKSIQDIPAKKIVLEAFTARRAQAERQCVNAIIQGSSATMTKIAMNKITRDPELASYGFKLLIGVHDELIGEVKSIYAEKGAERLCEIMRTCVKDLMTVSFKCDPSIEFSWYFSEMAHALQDRYKELQKENKTENEILNIIKEENSEFYSSEIDNLLNFVD